MHGFRVRGAFVVFSSILCSALDSIDDNDGGKMPYSTKAASYCTIAPYDTKQISRYHTVMKMIAIQDGHNASVAFMEDGEIRFAVQEERLVRVKNAAGFPEAALKETLNRLGLSPQDIDTFLFTDTAWSGGWKKDQGVEFILQKHRAFFEGGVKRFDILGRIKKILKRNSYISRYLEKKRDKHIPAIQERRMKPLLDMGVERSKIKFIDHHLCHAASAAYGSGWMQKDKFVVVTSDGAGDLLSGTVYLKKKGNMKKLASISVDDSIARVYALMTYFMGMVPLEHEYKIMGLAAYASGSKQARRIADYFRTLFTFDGDLTYSRAPGIPPTHELGKNIMHNLRFERFDHLAAGLQLFVEEFVSEWIQRITTSLDVHDVALSGGLFMNVKLNKKILELPEVNDFFVFPSCGDETNVFGALYWYFHETTGQYPKPLQYLYLGGDFTDEQVEQKIAGYKFKNKIVYKKSENIEKDVANLLAQNEIVARLGGRMEFGARSLGNRAILADPKDWGSVKIINRMIKCRDFWMPFAPSCIHPEQYYENPKHIKAPYMILAFDAKKDTLADMTAATHPYDETLRPQEVFKETNENYFDLISEFQRITGRSIILNTSFNLHGFPIVYTPEDALFVFDNSGLNHLALENYLVTKTGTVS